MNESEKIEMQIRQESKKCLYREKKIQISDLIRYYENATHHERWDRLKKSNYIESIILSYPLEPFILVEFEESYVIIDGNERIKSIIDFVNGSLKVTLTITEKIDNITYNNLTLSRKNQIMRKNLTALVLNESTDNETLYHIYHSLNI